MITISQGPPFKVILLSSRLRIFGNAFMFTCLVEELYEDINIYQYILLFRISAVIFSPLAVLLFFVFLIGCITSVVIYHTNVHVTWWSRFIQNLLELFDASVFVSSSVITMRPFFYLMETSKQLPNSFQNYAFVGTSLFW